MKIKHTFSFRCMDVIYISGEVTIYNLYKTKHFLKCVVSKILAFYSSCADVYQRCLENYFDTVPLVTVTTVIAFIIIYIYEDSYVAFKSWSSGL
jgi:hypothetical protein